MTDRTAPAHNVPAGMAYDKISEVVADRIVRLGRSLQARGVDISLAEIIDATRAADVTDLRSRRHLRLALRHTMVKNVRHLPLFDEAFDRLFPIGLRPSMTSSDSGKPDPAAIIASDDDLGALAAELVDAHGGLDGENRSEGHHIQRAYRGADLARLMTDARAVDPTLTAEEVRLRIEELKRLMAAEIRGRIGESDDTPIGEQVTDVDFLNASRAELEEMRVAIRPLARKVAARLARRRQSQRRGRVNMRRTARRSLGSGGVPFDVAYDRPRVHHPELFVLCDISGSVAEFSLFTLTLMSALSAELAKTRTFVFADAIDEVSGLLASTQHGIEPWQLMRNSNVIRDDGHSDYGAVLEQFWAEVGEFDLRLRSTVIVTGDARSNYRPAKPEILARIAGRSRRMYWLNPEPKAEWATHDSEMERYAALCTRVFEVRNLRQLAATVEAIL